MSFLDSRARSSLVALSLFVSALLPTQLLAEPLAEANSRVCGALVCVESGHDTTIHAVTSEIAIDLALDTATPGACFAVAAGEKEDTVIGCANDGPGSTVESRSIIVNWLDREGAERGIIVNWLPPAIAIGEERGIIVNWLPEDPETGEIIVNWLDARSPEVAIDVIDEEGTVRGLRIHWRLAVYEPQH